MAALVKWMESCSDLKYRPYISLERDEENRGKFQVRAVCDAPKMWIGYFPNAHVSA